MQLIDHADISVVDGHSLPTRRWARDGHGPRSLIQVLTRWKRSTRATKATLAASSAFRASNRPSELHPGSDCTLALVTKASRGRALSPGNDRPRTVGGWLASKDIPPGDRARRRLDVPRRAVRSRAAVPALRRRHQAIARQLPKPAASPRPAAGHPAGPATRTWPRSVTAREDLPRLPQRLEHDDHGGQRVRPPSAGRRVQH